MLIRSTKKILNKTSYFVWFLQQNEWFRNTVSQEKFIDVFSESFTYKVQYTWFFQSNISTKIFNALQMEWQRVKLLSHSNLTKSNLLYSLNYTHDDYNLQPNKKLYQKKYLFTGLTLAAKSSLSFQSTIWLRPAWKRQEIVNFPTLIWRINGSSDTPDLSELARVSLINLLSFLEHFQKKNESNWTTTRLEDL